MSLVVEEDTELKKDILSTRRWWLVYIQEIWTSVFKFFKPLKNNIAFCIIYKTVEDTNKQTKSDLIQSCKTV